MSYFNIRFTFIDGDTKTYRKFTADDYSELARGITNNPDGWFGVVGDIVNLSNVRSCRIIEVDENGYEIKE